MALRAGAQLADLEFYQFHPTALATATSLDSSPFLISEAVRGEGAILLDTDGRRFMPQVHAAAELAPRDVVARGIASQMALQQGLPVLLDATAMSPEFLAKRFPSIDAETRARNLDWSHNPIPINPAAHYWMGGVRTDTFGRSSIPGLYAVGEVACTGVHGANRLASNSLLESLTFAWRCAHLLLQSDSLAPDVTPFTGTVTFLQEILAATPGRTVPITRLELQTLLWTHAGIERNATGLRFILNTLTNSHAEGITVYDLETANLLALARVLVTAALAREESRGAHFRTDFPQPSRALEHSHIYAQDPNIRQNQYLAGRRPVLRKPSRDAINAIVRMALLEDAPWGDLTSQTLIPATASVTAQLVAREPGVLCGEDLITAAFTLTDPAATTDFHIIDGEVFTTGAVIATIHGPARGILQAERVALNFAQRLCGIATLTSAYVRETEGTHARITDTRKTTPGLRLFERYAVRCGGGIITDSRYPTQSWPRTTTSPSSLPTRLLVSPTPCSPYAQHSRTPLISKSKSIASTRSTQSSPPTSTPSSSTTSPLKIFGRQLSKSTGGR